MNEIKKYLSEIGKKGGRANVEKNGLKHMSEIGKKGAEKRWKKLSTPSKENSLQ